MTITDEQFDSVSQNAHIAGGAAAVWGGFALFAAKGLAVAAVGLFVFAAVKEFWFDYVYETPEVRGSSIRDFVSYMIGAGVATAALWAKYKLET